MTFFRFIKRYSGQVPADTPDKEIRISDISDQEILQISKRDVLEFMNFLVTERKNSINTRAAQNNHTASIL